MKQLTNNLREEYFRLKYMVGATNTEIYNNQEKYKTFWGYWNSLNSPHKSNDPKKEDLVKKNLRHLSNNILSSSKFRKRREGLKGLNKQIVDPIDAVNQVIVEETRTDVVYDKLNNKISRTLNKTIVAKKIERIEFASVITINTLETITSSQELAQEWFEDYKNALHGRETTKFQFTYLEMATKFKKIALDLADKLDQIMEGDNISDIILIQNKMRTALKMAEMMDKVMETEMNPIKVMNIIHETGSARQKELAGAVATDRAMIDCGNIVFKEEKEVFNRAEMRSKLKEQGYNHIQNLLTEELKNVGAIEDTESKEPNNIDPIKDGILNDR